MEEEKKKDPRGDDKINIMGPEAYKKLQEVFGKGDEHYPHPAPGSIFSLIGVGLMDVILDMKLTGAIDRMASSVTFEGVHNLPYEIDIMSDDGKVICYRINFFSEEADREAYVKIKNDTLSKINV